MVSDLLPANFQELSQCRCQEVLTFKILLNQPFKLRKFRGNLSGSPYAKNPFDSVTDDELNEYKKTVERKRIHGECKLKNI